MTTQTLEKTTLPSLKTQVQETLAVMTVFANLLANETKARTSEALVSLSRLATDNAPTLDEKLGVKYGDYARSAARSLESGAAKLDAKSLDELGEDAREMIRKSPGTAVAVAVGAGFLLARLFRTK